MEKQVAGQGIHVHVHVLSTIVYIPHLCLIFPCRKGELLAIVGVSISHITASTMATLTLWSQVEGEGGMGDRMEVEGEGGMGDRVEVEEEAEDIGRVGKGEIVGE